MDRIKISTILADMFDSPRAYRVAEEPAPVARARPTPTSAVFMEIADCLGFEEIAARLNKLNFPEGPKAR